MSKTLCTSAFAFSIVLSACSSGQSSQNTSGGMATAGTTTGGSAPIAVSTLTTFFQDQSCPAAPTSISIDLAGNLYVVAGTLLQILPDGGAIELLEFTPQVLAVAASPANVFVSEGKPVALFTATPASLNQMFLTGGNPGCADSVPGMDGGVGFGLGTALAADPTGDVYIADWSATELGCTKIRKVDSSGTTTTFAGTGVAGYQDGPSSVAQFDEPSGITIDASHNLYVSDSFNNRIRMVSPSGMTTTYAGNGDAGFVDASGTPNTQGSATFDLPTGIAIDSYGNLYVADTNNNAIRMIATDGSTTTLAGNGHPGNVNGTLGQKGTTEFNYPIGVAVDLKGNVYVADHGNCAIRVITPSATP